MLHVGLGTSTKSEIRVVIRDGKVYHLLCINSIYSGSAGFFGWVRGCHLLAVSVYGDEK